MTKNLVKPFALIAGLIVIAGLAAAQSTDPKPFLGSWKGTLSVGGQSLEIGLNFSLDEAKKIQGTFDSISQGAMGLKLGTIEIKDKAISCVVEGVPGAPTFKGKIDATGKKLVGDFTQAGYTG